MQQTTHRITELLCCTTGYRSEKRTWRCDTSGVNPWVEAQILPNKHKSLAQGRKAQETSNGDQGSGQWA